MIWHIFKKDVRLLWWLAAAVATLDLAKAVILLQMGLFPQNPQLGLLMQLLSLGGLLGAGFAIASVVHQDAIPGVRQDWLVRPIRRRDLLLAKLLFVIVMVQLPVLLCDFLEAAGNGLPLGRSLDAAYSRSLFLLLILDIPFLAFASLTKNLLEAITGGVGVFFAVAILTVLTTQGGNRFIVRPVVGTGLEWIVVSVLLLVLLAGGSGVLGLQFFRRRTALARYITAALTVAGFLITFMPWRPAYAIEKSLSRIPGAANEVALGFSPASGRFRPEFVLPNPLFFIAPDSVHVYLPVAISGLPDDSAILTDHLGIQLIDSSGHAQAIEPYTQGVRALRKRTDAQDRTAYQLIVVPPGVYQRFKNQPARLSLDYSFTLFQFASESKLPALNGQSRIPNVGWCATRINGAETAVQLRCEQAGPKPGCVILTLKHIPTGQTNPSDIGCEGQDYSPFTAWHLIPDSLSRFGGNLAFRDRNGLAKYPVDGSKLSESQVVMQLYEPTEHFARQLVIPDIRLGDWEAETPSRR